MNVEHSIFLECYPSELNQVFLNLIINANQAMEEEGILKIDIEDRGASAVVRFSDNGCGIPDEVIKKIFNPLKIERIRTI